jgi:hypothetical protein
MEYRLLRLFPIIIGRLGRIHGIAERAELVMETCDRGLDLAG